MQGVRERDPREGRGGSPGSEAGAAGGGDWEVKSCSPGRAQCRGRGSMEAAGKRSHGQPSPRPPASRRAAAPPSVSGFNGCRDRGNFPRVGARAPPAVHLSSPGNEPGGRAARDVGCGVGGTQAPTPGGQPRGGLGYDCPDLGLASCLPWWPCLWNGNRVSVGKSAQPLGLRRSPAARSAPGQAGQRGSPGFRACPRTHSLPNPRWHPSPPGEKSGVTNRGQRPCVRGSRLGGGGC